MKMEIKDGKIRFPSGALFVEKEKMIAESLFEAGGTARGTFKVLSGGIMFRDAQGEPIFFCIMNKYREQFFVSCSRDETMNNRTRYMHSTTESIEKMLGLEDYCERNRAAVELWKSLRERQNAMAT